ncbi:outer membrane beta-barrel protein [Pontibacter sp. CAU 1760]
MQKIYQMIGMALVLLLAFHVPLQAQSDRNNGYIGVGLGPSFLLGNSNLKAGKGLHLNLLNVGYAWGKGFGVTGTWVGGAHMFDSEVTVHDQGTTYHLPAQVELSYGALMLGPMYTLHLTDDSFLDFKLRVGSLYTSEKTSSESYTATFENRSLGASLGVGYRKKIANRWCVMLSSDYYAGRKQYTLGANQSTHILNLTGGVGFVL